VFGRASNANEILVLGGYDANGPIGGDDSWRYDRLEHTWSRLALNPGSPCPFPRIDSSACFLGVAAGQAADHLSQVVFLFGGVVFDNEQALILNDMWRLDVSITGTSHWTCLQEECPPAERGAHVLCTLQEDHGILLLHGGEQMGQIFGDTWLYHAKTNAWVQVEDRGFTPKVPGPRFGHAACSLDGNRVAIFGGLAPTDSGAPEYLNDLWIFQLTDAGGMTGVWVAMDMLEGLAPSPRDKPGMCATADGKGVIIFGGYGLEAVDDAEDVGDIMEDGDVRRNGDGVEDGMVTEVYLNDAWGLALPEIGRKGGPVDVAVARSVGIEVSSKFESSGYVELPVPEGWEGGRAAGVVVERDQALVFGGYAEDLGFFAERVFPIIQE